MEAGAGSLQCVLTLVTGASGVLGERRAIIDSGCCSGAGLGGSLLAPPQGYVCTPALSPMHTQTPPYEHLETLS